MLQTAGQKATQAKTTLSETVIPALSSFMGKGKEVLGAAGASMQKAYVQSSARKNNQEQMDGEGNEDEFTLVAPKKQMSNPSQPSPRKDNNLHQLLNPAPKCSTQSLANIDFQKQNSDLK